ncbi:MAG: PKD domain-containing protein, partial [Thermoplasmata archaeon]|nr:PKD domain-containing protein [Thermoplasmata archaeon]
TGEAPALVAFSLATFTGGASPYAFEWTFGDGTVASGGSAANHTYARAGSYTAKLTITDGLGEAISAQASIEVLPSVTLSVVSGFGSVYQGSEVNLTVRSAGGESPYSYSWVGLPAACASEDASTLACIPSTAGTYEVAVTVTDGLGRSAVANGTVVVVATQGTSPPTPSSGGSFPIGYGIGALVVAAVAIALVAFWAGRRRGRSGAPPSSTPDGPFERYAQEAPDEGTGEPRSPPA